jgi:hypothetical protein
MVNDSVLANSKITRMFPFGVLHSQLGLDLALFLDLLDQVVNVEDEDNLSLCVACFHELLR